jgi:hypothetical protein
VSETAQEDARQLKALGYTSHFDRTMSIWENFSLGFTYLSPVVGVYTLFAMSFSTGGPPIVWSYVLIGLAQLLVCLVFGEIVSQFPISGGLYPWARRLVGKRWAWMAGWVYVWALWVTVAAVATGGAPFFATLIGVDISPAVTTAIAVAMIAAALLMNLSGTRLLSQVAMFGFVCELIGAIAVGIYLLLFARHQDWSALFDTRRVVPDGAYWPAFFAAALAPMFCYYGFEACGDVAEETPNASRTIPKAMRMTIYVGGFAAILVCLALVMAVPDVGAVLKGDDKDPVATTLRAAMGCGQPRRVRLCARRHDRRQRMAQAPVAPHARADPLVGAFRGDSGRHRGVRVVAAERGGHDHQFRGDRHLRGVPDDRAGRADGAPARMAAGRPVLAGRARLAREHRRARLAGAGDHRHGMAAQPPGPLVEQLFGDVHDRRRAGPGSCVHDRRAAL